MTRKFGGFSLIELMIVVAIIGILASVIVPSYQNQVNKSRRTDATIALTGAAHGMERHYTRRGSYEDAVLSDAKPAPDGTVYMTSSPEGFYDLEITSAELKAQEYLLKAIPKGAMANDSDCGTYTLNHQQIKCVIPVGGTESCSTGSAAEQAKVKQCW